MAKTDTLALVTTLSNGMADVVTIAAYYDQVMYELGREQWFVEASVVSLDQGQLEVDLRAEVGPMLVKALTLIYDNRELEAVPLRQLQMIDNHWRDAAGYPRSYVTEMESADVVGLHPAPQLASNPSIPLVGEPLGVDYPTYNLLLFYSYAALPPFDAPWYYLELIIALRVLALEFARESDHTDLDFSAAAQGLYTLCKTLLA